MRALSVTILFLGASLFAQTRPGITGSFGNVVFPGGTAAQPGVHRSFGNATFPGTGGPKISIPFSITDPTFATRLGATVSGHRPGGYPGNGGHRRNNTIIAPVAVPVYVGGSYDMPYAEPPAPQQPNVTVVYPPQQTPVIINQYGSGSPQQQTTEDTVSVYQAPVNSGNNANGQSMNEPATGYLIALKDHTIYNAVAYWIDGDTLHYFTSGNNHNQASLSLVDRELTDRLNREKGTEVRLPK